MGGGMEIRWAGESKDRRARARERGKEGQGDVYGGRAVVLGGKTQETLDKTGQPVREESLFRRDAVREGTPST